MHSITELDKKGLREFGLVGGSIVAISFGTLLPMLRHQSLPIWPWAITLLLWVWAIAAPTSLNLLYQPWMRVGFVLGWIQTRLILIIVFYTMVTPMGLVRQVLHQNSIVKHSNLDLSSYRQASQQRTGESMEKSF